MKRFKAIPFQLILFVYFIGCLTLFINSKNILAFGLQSRCIESIVDNGTIYLDTLTDKMGYFTSNYTWDAFAHEGHIYINKQPGQFFLGAIPYFFLKLFGVTYKTNFNLSCGIITLFTSVLMTSVIMVLIFNIAFNIVKNRLKSFLIAFLSGFGTLLLPYSGILQHDMCATFFLVLGFYFLFHRHYINDKNAQFMVFLSGFFTTLSFFSSYNAVTIIFIVCLYALLKNRTNEIILFGVASVIGILLSLVFNSVVFGNPFDFAIVLYSNFFHQSNEFTLKEYLPSILKRIDLYLLSPITAIEFYSPIYIVSYLGILLLPKKYFIEKIVLFIAFPIQFFQPCLFGVAGYGWCQYGPRYLIESIPFTMIGLCGFFAKEKSFILAKFDRFKLLNIFIAFLGALSVLISAVGTLGVVYCNYGENGFVNYIKNIISNNNLPVYYFSLFGVLIILMAFCLLFLKYNKLKKIDLLNYQSINQRISRRIGINSGVFLFIIISYTWFLSSGTWNLFQTSYLGTIFDSLGDGVLKGTYEVDKYALAWEAFIVNGKYYTYWGAFPAFLRIVLNSVLHNNYGKWSNLSCLIASSLSLYIYLKSLMLVLNQNKELSFLLREKIATISLLFLGFGSPFLFLSSMGQIYHESNLWGFCFGILGVYYFLSYCLYRRLDAILFLSLTASFALITRITFFISVGFLLLICIIHFLIDEILKKEVKKIQLLFRIVLILIPLLIAMLFQGDYNYKRFGSYTKFADYKNYNLITQEKFRGDIYFKYGLLNIDRLGYTTKSYFAFNKNCFDVKYPYVKQSINRTEDTKNVLIYETLPFLISAPWLLLVAVLGLIFLFRVKHNLLYKIGLLGCFVQSFVFLLLFEVHQRYCLDLLIGMIYSSFPFFMNIGKVIKSKFYKPLLFFILLLGVFSILTNVISTLDAVKYFWKN